MTTIIIYLGIFIIGFVIGVFSSKIFEKEDIKQEKEFDFEKMNKEVFGDLI